MSTLKSEDAEVIQALKLGGVQLYRNQWRYYPGGTMSAKVLALSGIPKIQIVSYMESMGWKDIMTKF